MTRNSRLMVPKVVLDANVLWSPSQRNLILQIASQELIHVFWTDLVVEEWLRNVTPEQRQKCEARTLPNMAQHFPDARLPPMPAMPLGTTHVDDRHVGAAAIHVAPSILLTGNTKHFDSEFLAASGDEVQTPDALLSALIAAKQELVVETVREAQANLTVSAPDWDAYMQRLSRSGFERSVDILRKLNAPANPSADEEPGSQHGL